jgi:MFS family permease
MKTWLRDNGLTLALSMLFLLSIVGQVISGAALDARERALAHEPSLSLLGYLASGPFLSSLFENWESEFLQMWWYVMLTAWLFQRGSPESRDPDDDEDRPGEGPGRSRSFGHWLYEHSLGMALLAFFAVSFALHWINSHRAAVEEAAWNGESPPTLVGYLGEPQFWFESFQNWQSEFLSTAVLVVLGIYLRELRSPESKAVGDLNTKTGAE